MSWDAKSAHVATLAGAEVYQALGAGDNVSYVSDIGPVGTRCIERPEWKAPLQAAVRRFLTKVGNDPGVIQPAIGRTGNLADWRDWDTPTLD